MDFVSKQRLEDILQVCKLLDEFKDKFKDNNFVSALTALGKFISAFPLGGTDGDRDSAFEALGELAATFGKMHFQHEVSTFSSGVWMIKRYIDKESGEEASKPDKATETETAQATETETDQATKKDKFTDVDFFKIMRKFHDEKMSPNFDEMKIKAEASFVYARSAFQAVSAIDHEETSAIMAAAKAEAEVTFKKAKDAFDMAKGAFSMAKTVFK